MVATIQLLAFGGAKRILGAPEMEFPLDAPCTAAELLGELCRRYPRLAGHQRSIRLAVNGAYVAASERVSPGDEVALIPPVAGG